MAQGKHQFGIGLVVGVLFAASFFMYFAPRYKTVEEDGVLYKHDRWSGNSWQFVENSWEEITPKSDKWETVDAELRRALKVPQTVKARQDVLNRLRDRYPKLKGVSDDDLLERIKFVYSKELMVGHYMQTIANIEEAEKSKESGVRSQ